MVDHETARENRLNCILDAFETLWQTAPCPDLNKFFQEQQIDPQHASHERPIILLEVLCIDLERRLRAGLTTTNQPLVADYVRQFPELTPSASMELAAEESRLRSKLGLFEFETDAILGQLPSLSLEQAQSLGEQLRAIRQVRPAVPRSQTEPKFGPGGHIGKYVIIRKLGEGGMGVVFEAEQDQSVRRRVAIKIIQSKFVSSEVISRFNVERQALSLMDHEHIARVFDSGITDSGWPYFVMELVEGLSITEFCDQHKLPLNQRLKLFVQICEAIHHAHQKGIIHRDLKPGNILVSMKEHGPHVKVIDFGVAKAIEPALRLSPETLQTGFGKLIGTLQYMSPEQAEANADIDVRSDVYSLGIILYELLTGSTPIDKQHLEHAALDQILSAIQKTDPPRPSSRLSSLGPRAVAVSSLRQTDVWRLNNELKGDLDWIAMKALEKDRKLRYDSASQFAEDIQRYLLGEAVSARHPSLSYRLRKVLRRHRIAISLFLGVMVMLLITTSVTTWQMFKANAEANRANSELVLRGIAETRLKRETQVALEQSQLALETLTGVVRELQSGLRNIPGAGPTRRRMLIAALDRIRKISARHVGDTLVNRGELQGLLELGDVVLQFGAEPDANSEQQTRLRESSLKVAQSLFQQAFEIASQLRASSPEDPVVLRDLAVATLKMGIVEEATGEIKSAQLRFEDMLNLVELLDKTHPATLQHRGFLAEALRRLGDISMRQGNTEKARHYYDRQLKASAFELALGASPQAAREYSVALEREGRLALETDQFDKAARTYRELLKTRRQLLNLNRSGVQERRDLAICLDLLSDALIQQDQLAEAADACREALQIFRELNNSNAGHEAQSDLAGGLIASSHVCRQQVRLAEAELLASEAREIYGRLAEFDTDGTSRRRNLAVSLKVLSAIQLLRGKWTVAKENLKQAQLIRRGSFEKKSNDPQAVRDYMAGQRELGQLSLKEHDFSSATREFQAGFDALQKLIDEGHLVEECRANQAIFRRDLDGSALGVIAVGDWKQVLQQPKDKLPLVLAFRCELLVPQRRLDEIAVSARYLAQLDPIEPDSLNDAAAGFASCMKLEAGWNGRESFPPESGLPPLTNEQTTRVAGFAEEALAVLRKAKAAGFQGLADNWNDPSFAALRENHQFRSLCGRSLEE